MPRRSVVTFAACVSALGVVVGTAAQSQAPAGQSGPTFAQLLLGNRAVSCRVSSALEVEVTFLDKSSTRVQVPAPAAAAPTPATDPTPAAAGAPVPPAPNPFVAAIRAAAAKVKEPVGAPARGFDEKGQPYVELRLGDGTVRRHQMDGVTVTKAGGVKEFTPATRADGNQAGTPPELSADPMRGRAWIELQSSAMLGVIRSLVNDNAVEIARFNLAESRATDGDLLAQMAYRATVARFLATTPAP